MINTPKIKSILAVDCGSTTTTAVLIERTKDGARLSAAGQAPSTYAAPWDDITLGVQEAVRYIEKIVRRTLLTSGGWPITPQTGATQGVDAFVVVCSAGAPLQVVVAGLIKDISLASARRAASTTYARITKALSLDTGDRNRRQSPEAQIQAIHQSKPEVVLLVGGTDGGAVKPVADMAQVIAMALEVWREGDTPHIVYAGNSAARTQIADILGPLAALKSVNNVRPRLDVEDLSAIRQEFETLYIQRKMSQLPGYDKLSNWSQYSINLASTSFERLVAYLGQHNQLNVAGINVGSRSTIVSTCAGQQVNSTIRSDAGVGHTLGSLLKAVPIERFHRWLPIELEPAELYNLLLNKSMHPATIPASHQELMIEQAVAREAIRLAASQTPQAPSEVQWNVIIGAGRTLTGTPLAAHAALMMIDGLEPWGVTNLLLDKSGLVNMVGATAAVDPVLAVQVVAQDAFLNLGTLVAPSGHGQPGSPALRIKVDYPDGDTVDREVRYGAIEVIPLPPGKKATIEVRPARHFDIGLGQPGRGAVAEVEGGVLGIIVDGRGRPLRLPKDDEERRNQLKQWLLALNVTHATTGNND